MPAFVQSTGQGSLTLMRPLTGQTKQYHDKFGKPAGIPMQEKPHRNLVILLCNGHGEEIMEGGWGEIAGIEWDEKKTWARNRVEMA